LRAVVQRCLGAQVWVDGKVRAAIGRGLCVFAAAADGDDEPDVRYLADKLAGLRVFPQTAADGGEGVRAGPARMTCNLRQVGGELLLVPQFTLYGDVRRGLRPDFTSAAPPERARAVLQALPAALRSRAVPVAEGVFGAHMRVEVINDGPVTILLDSARRF